MGGPLPNVNNEEPDNEIHNKFDLLSPNVVGHIIPLRCGHTGQPSSEESYVMEKHLRAAGFLNQRND